MIAAVRNRLRPPWRAHLLAVLDHLTNVVKLQHERINRLDAEVATLRGHRPTAANASPPRVVIIARGK